MGLRSTGLPGLLQPIYSCIFTTFLQMVQACMRPDASTPSDTWCSVGVGWVRRVVELEVIKITGFHDILDTVASF